MATTRRQVPPSRLRADRAGPLRLLTPGTVPYGQAWELQRRLVEQRAEGRIDDVLVSLQHPRVYTAGKRADPANLVFDAAERERRGIELFEVDRGGDFTYHGPGQLVGYPILELAGPHVVDYVRALEQVLIRLARSYDVDAHRVEGYTGVWVGDEKLAAIGVRVSSRYVTSHGFALNVDPDLEDFTGIVPCGIPDRGVCSLTSLGVATTFDDVATRTHRIFAETFDATLEPSPPDALGLLSDLQAGVSGPPTPASATKARP